MNTWQPVNSEGLLHQMSLLWQRQSENWTMLAEGLAALRQARVRTFQVDGWRVTAQCNPARINSSSARIDSASIAERPCFLCTENRPPAQASLPYGGRWLILCNPAPLFEPHFTIVSAGHEPQRVGPAIEGLLSLAQDLDGRYTLFYNGPHSGASAPDHLHLQASRAGTLPFETELATQLTAGDWKNNHRWLDWLRDEPVRVAVTRPIRPPVIVLMGQDQRALTAGLLEVVDILGQVRSADPEPMLNLFVTHTEDSWVTWLFPRAAHRPRFYGDDPDSFLISPGAADLAGIVVTPRPEDFDRLEDESVQSIFREVLLGPEEFARFRELVVAGAGTSCRE